MIKPTVGLAQLFHLILMAFTAISVLGTFSFAAVEPFHPVKSELENKTKIFGSLENFFLQHPAEEPIIIAKLGSPRFFPARMGFQRIVSLLGSPTDEKPYAQLSIIACIKKQYSDLKNNILLKLRI